MFGWLRRRWFVSRYGHEPPHRWGVLQRGGYIADSGVHIPTQAPVFYTGCMDCRVEALRGEPSHHGG